MIDKLKDRHENELRMRLDDLAQKFYREHRWSKPIVEQRQKERVLFSLKQYEEAQLAKEAADQMEREEMEVVHAKLQIRLAKDEQAIRKQQEVQMQSLLKRIRRDRDEQVKHRHMDSVKLIQRNKNVLKDVVNKQGTERRRTKEFLRYALGKREETSTEHLVRLKGVASRAQIPLNPPIMKPKSILESLSVHDNSQSVQQQADLTHENSASKASL